MTSTTDAVRGSRPPTGLLKGSSLFLDFDGTLVDIAPRPDAVSVSSDLRHLLERLRDRLDGRLAILTGRSAVEVERLLDPLCVAIGGHHGLETRNTGTSSSVERPPELDEIVAELRQLEREHPGVLLEDKPLAIALHYREAPDAEDVCRAAVERAAERSGLEVQPGKMVFELRPSGANKGDALRRLLEAPLFAGSKPIFLGDDLTDEPAFIAAQDLGGAGVLIGERKSTAASYRLESVGEALAWLEDACKEAQ